MNFWSVWIYLFILVVLVAYMMILALKGTEQKGFNLGVTLFLALVFVTLIYIPNQLVDSSRWGVFLALLPAAIITSHAIFLGLFRRKELRHGKPESLGGNQQHLVGALQLIDKDRDRYFSAASLGIRYGLPALLLIGVGVIAFPFFFGGVMEKTITSMRCFDATKMCSLVVAARLGIAGAYVYVLTYLGERNFRHDVTSGGAMWCVATLVLGPILAVILSLSWNGGAPTGYTTYAIYFAAGIAPRQVASWIMEAIRRLQQPSGALVAMPRVQPLTMIRGITRGIEDRLREEGIEDVFTLAMANPLWLLRNTPYSKRQIVDWIDEAMLMKVAPDGWETFEKRGITGVIDLAYLLDQKASFPSLYEELSRDTGLSPLQLDALVNRMYFDKQVQVIWALYQIDAESLTELDTTGSLPS